MKKQILKKSKYTISFTEYASGGSLLSRKNDGFSALELLGLLELIQSEILGQMSGENKPTKIERKVVDGTLEKIDSANKVKEWIRKGEKILDKKYHESWSEIVPIRLSDLYEGMELGACLAIIEKLNAGCDIEEANDIIKSQGHSGMSYSLVASMVSILCERGAEFVKYINK